MASVTFNSPGQMIGSGIGILILGYILLDFGIGFIGALFGFWWILKGIFWQMRLSSGGGKSQAQQQIMKLSDDLLRAQTAAAKAGNYTNKFIYRADIIHKIQIKKAIVIMAALDVNLISQYMVLNVHEQDFVLELVGPSVASVSSFEMSLPILDIEREITGERMFELRNIFTSPVRI